MARRSNKLVWLIGIPVISLGLAHWGLHWYVKQRLDQAIMDVSPRFTVEYAKLKTSLQGSVDVADISIVPVGQSDAFRISRVSIQGPDVLTYLLNHNPVTGDKGPPEHLNVKFSNLNLDLTGSLASNLDQNYKLSLQQQGVSAPAACSVAGGVSLSMLKDMGQKSLAGDGNLFYRYDKAAYRLRSTMEMNIRDIQSLSMEVTFANVLPQALKSGSPGIPSLSDFRVTMKVLPVFGKKISRYCADQTGQSIAEYEEQIASSFMQNLADNGIVLGQGLRMAVRSYYTNWGEIDIIAKPVRPVNLLSLMFTPPQNMEETLGLQVAINDRMLTDLDFKLQKGAKLFVAQPKKKNKKPTPPRPRYKMVWKKVSAANLRNHLYRDVKLHVVGQPVRNGILVGIEGNSALVEQRVNSGKFTAHVPIRNITRAEAKFRVRTNPPSTPEKGKAEQADTQQAQATTQQGQHADGQQVAAQAAE